MCVLNVQHNCHDAKCQLGKTHFKKIEWRVSTIRLWGMEHVDSPCFILNGGSHYYSHLHRQLSDLQLADVSPEEWNLVIKKGIKKWNEEKNGKNAQDDDSS